MMKITFKDFIQTAAQDHREHSDPISDYKPNRLDLFVTIMDWEINADFFHDDWLFLYC